MQCVIHSQSDPSELMAVMTDGAVKYLRRHPQFCCHSETLGLHCYCHVLNLSIMAKSKIKSVQNVMNTVRADQSSSLLKEQTSRSVQLPAPRISKTQEEERPKSYVEQGGWSDISLTKFIAC